MERTNAHRSPALLLLPLLGALSGCLEFDLFGYRSDPEGPLDTNRTAEKILLSDGDCLREEIADLCLDNPAGCAEIRISQQVSGLLCELCVDDAGETIYQRCGGAEHAECNRQETDDGVTCSICRTAGGDEYYNSCHRAPNSAYASSCEGVSSSSGERCEVCYDDQGNVISRTCFEAGYWCEERLEGDQWCEVCYDEEDLVSEICEPANSRWRSSDDGVSPDYCEGFTAADGYTCHVCYDQEGAIVAHDCSGEESVRCETFYPDDGSVCEVCYDSTGRVSGQSCSGSIGGEECGEYRTEAGTCYMCFDEAGVVTYRDCRSSCVDAGMTCTSDDDCAMNSVCFEGLCSCEASPSCTLFTREDGTLCEICGDLNDDGFIDEDDAVCFPDTPGSSICSQEWHEASDGPGSWCTVCASEVGGVSEACEPERAAFGVSCLVEEREDSGICQVCRDLAGGVFHHSCPGLACEGKIIDAQGVTEQPVSCQACRWDGALYSLGCDLDAVCTAGQSVGGPDEPPQNLWGGEDACGNVWLRREPLQCNGTPWLHWWIADHPDGGFNPEHEGEILRAYYAQLIPAIEVAAYRIEHAFVSNCMECSCPRGDVIFVYVSAAGGELLADLGWHYQ